LLCFEQDKTKSRHTQAPHAPPPRSQKMPAGDDDGPGRVVYASFAAITTLFTAVRAFFHRHDF
jgi:hypothetical protein